MRRLLTVLAMAICLVVICIPALAEEETVLESVDARDGIFIYGGYPEQGTGISGNTGISLFAMRRSKPSLDDYLAEQLLAGEDRVDISDYAELNAAGNGLTAESSLAVRQAFQNAVNMHAELFYLKGTYQVAFNSGAILLRADTLYSGFERAAMLSKLNAEIDKIVDYAQRCSDDDLGQVVAVNDYICRHFAYDETFTVRDAYNFLTGGKGVCQAYMVTVSTVMQRLGIPVTCVYNENPAINHTWNAVQIDGEWYQMDVTWNDPIPDFYGYVQHQTMLMSMSASVKQGHGQVKDIVTPVSTNDTTYDSMFWNSVNHSFLIDGDDFYFVRAVAGKDCTYELVRWNSLRGTFTTIGEPFTSYWPYNEEQGSYYSTYCGAVGSYEGYLIYTTADGVYAINPKGGAARQIFTAKGGLISGAYIEDGVLYYGKGNYVNAQTSRGNEWPIKLENLPPLVTAKPTNTAKPADTAKPTNTAKPNDTAKPTNTANPTATARPTALPDAPKIVAQPKSQYAVIGQNATFEISASGTNLSYQWYVNYNDGKGWRAIIGANSYRYTTSPAALANDGYQYFCHVRDAAGQSANTYAVRLYVSETPVVPPTGDSSMPLLWSLLVLAGCAGVILVLRRMRRS